MTENITIRQVEGQEMLDIVYLLDNYAFRPSPPFPNRDEWDERMKTRKGSTYYALFDGEDPVAVELCIPMTQNLRGKLFKMGGFAGVASHPKARRKGYVRQLIAHAYQKFKDDGVVVSCLYPFRESFYERLGYVTFPQTRQAIFSTVDLAPLLKKDFRGEVEMVLIGDAYDEYRDYVKQMMPGVHGMSIFDHSQKESAQSNRSWVATARVDGELVGLMIYTTKGDEMMNYTIQATRFYYRTSQGKYLLLAWLARHIDQATKAKLWLPAFEQPNTWLHDIRPKLEPVFVSPMGRVLDVSGIEGMEVGPGSFTAKVEDPHCPWNNGTWKFEGRDGLLEVAPAQNPDLTLSIQGLSALVYGVNDPADFAIRGWGNPSPELITVLQEMFPPKLPYLHEYY
jgi:hypothetical protein